MKSIFLLIKMSIDKREGSSPWGKAKDDITWTLLFSSGYNSFSQPGSQNRAWNKIIALNIIAKVNPNPTVNYVWATSTYIFSSGDAAKLLEKNKTCLFIYFYFNIFYCCSSTVSCIFRPPLPTTTALPTSLPCFHTPAVIVHVSFIIVPCNPLLSSLWSLSACSQFQLNWESMHL